MDGDRAKPNVISRSGAKIQASVDRGRVVLRDRDRGRGIPLLQDYDERFKCTRVGRGAAFRRAVIAQVDFHKNATGRRVRGQGALLQRRSVYLHRVGAISAADPNRGRAARRV